MSEHIAACNLHGRVEEVDVGTGQVAGAKYVGKAFDGRGADNGPAVFEVDVLNLVANDSELIGASSQ